MHKEIQKRGPNVLTLFNGKKGRKEWKHQNMQKFNLDEKGTEWLLCSLKCFMIN